MGISGETPTGGKLESAVQLKQECLHRYFQKFETTHEHIKEHKRGHFVDT